VQPDSQHGDRPAVGVVRRVGNELIIRRDVGIGEGREAIVRLENILEPRVRQDAVADQDPQAAGVEEPLALAREVVQREGDAGSVIGASPRVSTDRQTGRQGLRKSVK